MTKLRRLLAVGAVLALVAWLTSPDSKGEPGKNVADPVVRAAQAELSAEAALAQSKFAGGEVISYQTLKGENLCACKSSRSLNPCPCAAAILSS